MPTTAPQTLVCATSLLCGALVTVCGVALSCRARTERAEPLPAGTAAAPSGSVDATVTAVLDAGAAVDSGEDAAAESVAPLMPLPLPLVWSPTTPAAAYGALSNTACEERLRSRGIPYILASGAQLVECPVRLTGSLHGVTFHGDGLANAKGPSVFDIADCRLALALDDFAASLARRGVVEVLHFSMHRPAPSGATAPPKALPRAGRKASKRAGKPSQPAARPGAKPAAVNSHRPSQHALGLATDVAAFIKADGSRLEVKTDWHGAIGTPPCGPGSAPRAPTPQALELRELVCGIYATGLFNVVLTPNANTEHADHFHFDIKRDAHYFLME